MRLWWIGLEVVPLIHNVSSVQRLLDFARLVYSLGLNTLVASKVYGAAAQSGVPEAMRLAFKLNRGLLVLSDLEDALELLKPDVTLLVSAEHAVEYIDPFNPPVYSGRVLIAFNGGDPDFSAGEARFGRPVYVKGVSGRLGAIAEASLILYPLLLQKRLGEA